MIKRVFSFVTVRYRGLAKNTQWLWVTCGLSNFVHGPASAVARLTDVDADGLIGQNVVRSSNKGCGGR